MSTLRNIIFSIYGLILFLLLAISSPFAISGCQEERGLRIQKEKILAFTDAEKAFILSELIRLSNAAVLKGPTDSIELDARAIPPPLSFLKPSRMKLRSDSAWLDLGYNFDHGVSLRASKERDGAWRLSAELEEFQPEKILYRNQVPTERPEKVNAPATVPATSDP